MVKVMAWSAGIAIALTVVGNIYAVFAGLVFGADLSDADRRFRSEICDWIAIASHLAWLCCAASLVAFLAEEAIRRIRRSS